jgi:hypothetical protein
MPLTSRPPPHCSSRFLCAGNLAAIAVATKPETIPAEPMEMSTFVPLFGKGAPVMKPKNEDSVAYCPPPGAVPTISGQTPRPPIVRCATAGRFATAAFGRYRHGNKCDFLVNANSSGFNKILSEIN